MKKLSPRAERLLALLKSDPAKRYTFADIAERFNTSASGAVSIVRSLARAGYGEFRDRVAGEASVYSKEEILARRAARKKRGWG